MDNSDKNNNGREVLSVNIHIDGITIQHGVFNLTELMSSAANTVRQMTDKETGRDSDGCAVRMLTPELPSELATEQAMIYWHRLQERGYMNEDYQPTCTKAEYVIIAYEMAKRLGVENMWSLFESFWGKKYCGNTYSALFREGKQRKFIEMVRTEIFY